MDWSEKRVDKYWESISEAQNSGQPDSLGAVNSLCQLKTLYLFFVYQKYLG